MTMTIDRSYSSYLLNWNFCFQLFQQMNVGDIIYGKIQSLQTGGHLVRLLCTDPSSFQIFNDLKARVTSLEF